MLKYTIRRLLQSIATILIVVTIVFLLLQLMPTDYYFTEEELIKLTDVQKHVDANIKHPHLDPNREVLIQVKDLQVSFGTGRKKFVAVDHA